MTRKEKKALYYQEHKEKISQEMTLRYKLKSDEILRYKKDYHSRDEVKKRRYERRRERTNIDPLYRLKHNISVSINKSMSKKGFKKNERAHTILGCSYEEFKIWIENRFMEGMTWKNYGMWQYDHIIPIDSALTEEEAIKLNHYTNFQPLWKLDNIRKGKKLNWAPSL